MDFKKWLQQNEGVGSWLRKAGSMVGIGTTAHDDISRVQRELPEVVDYLHYVHKRFRDEWPQYLPQYEQNLMSCISNVQAAQEALTQSQANPAMGGKLYNHSGIVRKLLVGNKINYDITEVFLTINAYHDLLRRSINYIDQEQGSLEEEMRPLLKAEGLLNSALNDMSEIAKHFRVGSNQLIYIQGRVNSIFPVNQKSTPIKAPPIMRLAGLSTRYRGGGKPADFLGGITNTAKKTRR
jgi:hypothetical protein